MPTPTVEAQIRTQTITEAEALAQEARDGVAREWVHGVWQEQKMAGIQHVFIGTNLYDALRDYVKTNPLGRPVTDGLTYVLSGSSAEIDVLRIPDVSFISQAQLANLTDLKGFAYFAPLLAVEVVSPSETPKIIQGKVNDYLTYGTQEVWVIYPEVGEVIVHRADHRSQGLGVGDTLITPLLPGFSVGVGALFGVGA